MSSAPSRSTRPIQSLSIVIPTLWNSGPAPGPRSPSSS